MSTGENSDSNPNAVSRDLEGMVSFRFADHSAVERRLANETASQRICPIWDGAGWGNRAGRYGFGKFVLLYYFVVSISFPLDSTGE